MASPPEAPPSRSDADELLGDDDDDFDDETCIEAFVFTLQEVVYSRWFNNAVLFVILANSVCMALEDPVIEDKWSEPGQAALAYLDFVFIGLFTIEMTLKLLALGVEAVALQADAADAASLVYIVVPAVVVLGIKPWSPKDSP